MTTAATSTQQPPKPMEHGADGKSAPALGAPDAPAPGAHAEVTIVVVPRERFSFAIESLASLYANTRGPFDLVYVDGGSPGYLRRRLQRQAKERGFTLIRTEHLLSPNEARNLGMRDVQTPFITFVDNDVIFTPGWLDALLATARRTGAWIVGPLTLEGPLENQIVHTIGADARIYTDEQGVRRLHKKQTLHLQPVANVRDQIIAGPTPLVEIHSVLVRTDKVRQVGGWDESLLTNHEHLDLCLRVRDAGGEVYFEPASVVTFIPGPPFRWSDYPFYLLRWNDAWNLKTNERFYSKFGANPEAGALDRHVAFVMDRRRRVALEDGLLRWFKPWLRRKRDGRYRRFARTVMGKIESALTRRPLARRAKAMMQMTPAKSAAQGAAAPAGPVAPVVLRAPAREGHIAMFHIGRCGSTVIGDLLGQHPDIQWDGEIFEPRGAIWPVHATPQDAVDPAGFLHKRFAAAGKPRYGFEIKFYQARLLNWPLEKLIAALDAAGFTRFIILSRRNYLRKIVSNLVARTDDRWHLPAGSAATLMKVRVPIEKLSMDHAEASLVDALRRFDDDLSGLESMLAPRAVLKLTYEDHIEADPMIAYRDICAFVPVAPVPAQVRLGRTTPFALREVIENYDEVAAALAPTPYAWMAPS